ncbi:MAG TPA: pitrilysin family protein, partial [Steroidobacteraceae bacterium]|nr:pitrilysin family protein [Steroidobacteraceae bacterium]
MQRGFRFALRVAALAIFFVSVGAQQTQPRAVQPSAPAKVTELEGITEYKLANGLRVLLFPDDSKPTVTVNITYLVGSRHESYGESGMAHLLEHLMFKGTPKHPDIPKEFNQHGVRFNGTTSFDRTNYFEMAQANDANLQWAIELESDRMVNSNIARHDLDSEMSVVRNEYERGENNPGGVLSKRMQSVAFDWHNYQNSPIGNRSDIENVEIPNLQAFYRKYYQPDNAVLLVAGQFDEQKALRLINNTFGKIPTPTRTLPKLWTVEPTQDGERSFTVRRNGNIQIVMLGYKVPSGLHPDAMALSFAASILSNSPNGRLHKLLVETNKAAGVGGGASFLVDPGLANIMAVVKEGESIDSVRKILIDTVEGFYQSPPTAEEMNRVRVAREKNYEQTLSSSESLALALSESIAMGDWRMWFRNQELAKTVTSEDVVRVSKTYFRRDNRTVGEFLPTAEPQRAEIPAAPLVADVLKDFKPLTMTAAGEAFDATPTNIDARTQRFTLSNGMKVALLPKKTRGETVNVALRSHFGDLQSRFGKSTTIGIASQMMTRGTTRFTRAQLADEFDKLKFSGNIGLGNANFRTTREHLVAALELTVHVLKEPTFPEAEFEQLRKQALTGIESSKSDPGALANEAIGMHFNRYSRGDPRYYESLAENVEDLKKVTIEQLQQVHREFTGFSNAEIAIVGDFEVSEVRASLEKLFANWASPSSFKRVENQYAVVDAANITIETPDKENAVFRAQLLIELRDDDPDFPALSLANYIFGGGAGLNARVAKRIRGKEGLSYGANTSLLVSELDRRGVFSASATAAPQNIAKLEIIFREELDLARRDGFTNEELANAKSGLLTSRKQRRAQEPYLATTWVDWLYLGKTFVAEAEFDAKYQAV